MRKKKIKFSVCACAGSYTPPSVTIVTEKHSCDGPSVRHRSFSRLVVDLFPEKGKFFVNDADDVRHISLPLAELISLMRLQLAWRRNESFACAF